MASVNSVSIYLHQRGTDAKNATLQLRYIYQRKPFYISTGIRIEVAQWDPKRGCLKVNRKATTEASANQLIEETNKLIEAFMLRAKAAMLDAERAGVEVTPIYLRKALERKVAEAEPVEAPVKPVGLLELWQGFNEDCQANRKVQPNTLKMYKLAKGHVERFALAGKYNLTFDVLTPKVVEELVTYLRNQGLVNTSIGGVIKNLKVFYKWAFEHGHTPAAHYVRFKKPKDDKTDFVYLTEQELATLAQAALPEHLERVRDLFVLQASTGLRYSDLANLKPENRQGNRLRIVTIKTKDPLFIPLSPTALSVYSKYEEQGLPKAIQNQPYNREIKEACRLAGITDFVPVTVIRRGLRVDASLPKYEKVTSHTARRTFIIHALENGIRPEVLMKVTGHKDIKTLMRYVKITQNVVEAEFERAWSKSALVGLK